jgi:competence protein ComGC
MKKIIAVVLLVLVAGLVAVPAFAASTDSQSDNSWLEQRMNWLEQRMNWKKANVDQMVENGVITEEQGKVWKEHFDQVYQFHQQNGFLCPGGGPGWGAGRMGGGNGYGPGMRGGFGGGPGFWQQGAVQNQ